MAVEVTFIFGLSPLVGDHDLVAETFRASCILMRMVSTRHPYDPQIVYIKVCIVKL